MDPSRSFCPIRPARARYRWWHLSVVRMALLSAFSAITLLWCRLLAYAGQPGVEHDDRIKRERGDVPGWVMITLMTAGLVAVLWVLAGERFKALFEQAMDAVSGRL